MTREENIKIYMANSKETIANVLYDTIQFYENRTCNGCIHFNSDGECEELDLLPDIGFSCNRWEGL